MTVQEANTERLTRRNSDNSVGIKECRYYNYDDFQKMAKKLAEYEDLGTVEELKEAREKQIAKKVIGIKAKLITRHCPSCQEWAVFELKRGMKFCPSCGQKLDWSEEDD